MDKFKEVGMRKRSVLKTLVLAGMVGCFLVGCAAQDDVSFARRLTEQLIQGRYSARGMMAWSQLKMVGYDVGKEYSALKSEDDKVNYERDFITNFSSGFKQRGAKAKAFFNWRMDRGAFKKSDPNLRIVAANCFDANTTFLFFIRSEHGKKKLVELKLNSH